MIVCTPTLEEIPQLWQLMYDLAVFEEYTDVFAVTEETIRQQMFDKFEALVAVDDDDVLGMAVYYVLP